MPMLMDIATVITGKAKKADTGVALIKYANGLSKDKVSIKNQLRTNVQFGDNANLGRNIRPNEGDGIFAEWCAALNKEPKHDIYQKQPINKVKKQDANDRRAMILETAYKNWLEGVEARMKALGFKE